MEATHDQVRNLCCVVLSLAVPAAAQSGSGSGSAAIVNGKPLTFECVWNDRGKNLEVQVTNPNGVDKKCDLSCTYTAKDKASRVIQCGVRPVFKNAKKEAICSEAKLQGSPPYSNLKASGKCN
jgi:hypothetical protein